MGLALPAAAFGDDESSYDPEKHIWIVEDRNHVVYKFTHDGKQLGADARRQRRVRQRQHAFQPPDVSRMAAGRHDVRVRRLREHTRREVRQGRQVPDGVGRKARRRTIRRPGTFNAVHGVQVDPVTRKVVRHRSSKPPHPGVRRKRQVPRPVQHRQPVDAAGALISPPTRISGSPTTRHRRSSSSTSTAITSTSWGSQGEWPGAMWNVHGMSVDQDGNLYLAEVNNGRPQKFRPRKGATPHFWSDNR